MALGPAIRERLEQLLRSGVGVRGTARLTGVSPMTVSRFAKSIGLDVSSPATAAPIAANKAYNAAERVRVIDLLFAKIEELMPTCSTPHKLQALATTLGIAIDKRRLEDGDATSRTEVTGDEAREQLTRRIHELAARRRSA